MRGVILRRVAPPDWREASFDALATASAEALAALHRLDPQLAGLGDIGPPASGAAQLEALVRHYQAARTPDSPDLGELRAWLQRRLPPAQRAALCHNDYKYDNLVLAPQSPSGIVAVLDWELASLGEPQYDVAWTLACWIEPGDAAELQAFGLTHLPGNPDRGQWLERYARHAAQTPADPVALYVFGLLRMAVALQQMYARYRRGEGGDARHARIVALVHEVAAQAGRAIRQDRISRLG
jgi:aminoglycoside phosphotransferase (APT) family kinase protein